MMMMMMNNTTTSSSSAIHVHIPSLRIIIACCCFILYVFGYTGCLLSVVTFSSKKLRCHSTGFLFLIMAFVDIFNLFASLQYFLDAIYQINVFALSIHWCRLFTIVNYELYFGFSWIFVFISVDRWIKVEWPTKSQRFCTRKHFIFLCLITFLASLIQNTIYTFFCLTNECQQKNLACEISIHIIYITIYMIIPIALILISISRTCLITLHIKKRFQPPVRPQQRISTKTIRKSDDNLQSILIPSFKSTSFVSSPSVTTVAVNSNHPLISSPIRPTTQLRHRRARLDTQMVILISINVVPFIFVHIINEIAYLFELYSVTVRESRVAKSLIILIYLSWYLISATRFYTNCLLSRIYREEFKNRLYMLRYGCKPRIIIVGQVQTRRHSSRPYLNGVESTIIPTVNIKSAVTM